MPMELEGMQQLMAQLQQMGKAINSGVEKKALEAGADYLKSKIELTTPIRTGKLKNSIITSDIENSMIFIGPQKGDAFYSHFLEFGTSKASANPFMGPTFLNHKDGAEKKMADVIKRELRL